MRVSCAVMCLVCRHVSRVPSRVSCAVMCLVCRHVSLRAMHSCTHHLTQHKVSLAAAAREEERVLPLFMSQEYVAATKIP
jgi:hypothetical protein